MLTPWFYLLALGVWFFVNDNQRIKYETLSARRKSKQKFWHMDFLRQLGMLDDFVTLLSNLGWMEYIEMNCVSYDRLIIEFLSSLNVDWAGLYMAQEVLISFDV